MCSAPRVSGRNKRTDKRAHIEVERHADDGQKPEDLIEPADVATEPVRVLVCERLEEQVEEVYRRQRYTVQQQRLEYV